MARITIFIRDEIAEGLKRWKINKSLVCANALAREIRRRDRLEARSGPELRRSARPATS